MNSIEKLKVNLPSDIDCGIVTSPINRRYLTGFPSSAGILLITREKSYFIVDFRYFEKAAQAIKNCEVILLENEKQQMTQILQEHHCQNIAVESYHMPILEFKKLKNQFPDFTFSSSPQFEDEILKLRMIKSSEEISKIIAAQKIAENAFLHILSFIHEGVTEKQTALTLKTEMLKNGADDMSFEPIVVSGRNSSSPHGEPTDKRFEEGDFVTMDFGAKKDGYCSDMTRTVFIGEPSREQTMFYKTVLVGQNLALDYIKAGLKGKEVDKIVREYFDSQNYAKAFGHGLGHGVGLEIHEDAYLNVKSETVLQSGMVATIEPGLYLPGKYGVRIEDMVVITENQCQNLTHCPKDLICL